MLPRARYLHTASLFRARNARSETARDLERPARADINLTYERKIGLAMPRRVGRRVVEGAEAAGSHGVARPCCAYYMFALFKDPSRAPAKITTRRNDKSRSFSPATAMANSTGGYGDTREHALYLGRRASAGAFGQPGPLNPRIGYAHRNHSDYPTRITMQMLVNSHVPSPSPSRTLRSKRSFRAEMSALNRAPTSPRRPSSPN